MSLSTWIRPKPDASYTPDQLRKLERRERRIAAVKMLRESNQCRHAFIAGPPTEEGTLVTIATRTARHGIIVGDLMCSPGKWDPAAFLSFLEDVDRDKP